MAAINVSKLKQGEIKSLFPNLGMVVFANGCLCELITVSTSGSHRVRVIDGFKSGIRNGTIMNVTSFLISDKLFYENDTKI